MYSKLFKDIDEDTLFASKEIRGFRNNTNLKQFGEQIEWSHELLYEYKKCYDDIHYFAETYFSIVHVDRGKEVIKFYPFQGDMLSHMKDNRNSIFLCARQIGKSTMVTIFILHYILFNRDKTVAILANKGDTAREILSRIQLAYENLPKWLQQGVKTWNKGSIELENGCKVIAAASSSSSIRGKSISLLYGDEVAFIPQWDEFYKSVYPTITSGQETKVILTSTANGYNHFYKLWTDAINKRNTYAPFEIKWNQVPHRNEKWKNETISNTSEEAFAQEHCNLFQGNSNTLIPMSDLSKLVYKNPIMDKDGLRIYEAPIEGASYVLTADAAEGLGLDNSAFSVFRIDGLKYTQVAAYKNNTISPQVGYPEIIDKISKYYNDAAILLEVNSVGIQVSHILVNELESENVLSTETRGRKGQVITGGFKKNSVRGVKTTTQTKRIGCSTLKDLIHSDKLIIYDYDTIHELSVFTRSKNSFSAESGETDDLVMTLVLFAWLSTQKYFKDLDNVASRNKLFQDQLEEMEEYSLPRGIASHFMNSPTHERIIENGMVWSKH